jgi:hypothetical protein
MLQTLTREKTIPITALGPSARSLNDIARFIDKKGATCGYFFSLEMLENLLEDIETSRPEFWAELEESRASGRVSGKKVEKELGI